MPDVYYTQSATWDGVIGAENCSYSAGHGETPGYGQFTTRISPDLMLPVSDLVFNDGVNQPVRIRGCKVVDSKFSFDSDGKRWYIRFADRRWRWEESGAISGHYNELDQNGKLVPWRIMSPTELTILCLSALGETNYQIDMPDGITSTQYANAPDYFTVGINTLPTGTNPEIIWQDTRPSAALLDLCNKFGRRLVFDPVNDRVIIARPGVGQRLPSGGRMISGANVSLPATPDAIGIVGSPTMYQGRFLLVPVALEWHKQFVPPDQVSWRPLGVPIFRSATITFQNGPAGEIPPDAGATLMVGNRMKYSLYGVSDAGTLARSLNAAINADPDRIVNSIVSGTTITLTGIKPGDPGLNLQTSWFLQKITNATTPGPADWSTCVPPTYYTARPTDRLTWSQARQHAAQSIFRTYRLADYGLGGPGTPIYVPGYGEVKRRQQLILQPTAVEQVIPQPIDLNQINRNVNGAPEGVVWDFYNGYSRNRDAAIYGTIQAKITNNWWIGFFYDNTPAGARIQVPFHIDPVNQLVTFAIPTWKALPQGMAPGNYAFCDDLVLEVGVQVMDDTTNEVMRYRRWYSIDKPKPRENVAPNINVPGNQGIQNGAKLALNNSGEQPPRWTEWHRHDDVWSEIVGKYTWSDARKQHVLTNVTFVDSEESKRRADYYLEGHVLEHIVQGGESAEYPGLHPISLDGAIQEVSWEIGRDGPKTRASYRMEGALYRSPYSVRRRAEALAAVADAAELNQKLPGGVLGTAQQVTMATRAAWGFFR